jgi:hypothetical protein
MDGPAFLLLAAGALTVALAGFGFWAWRRSVGDSQPAGADAQSGALALPRTTSSPMLEETGAVLPHAAPLVADFWDTKGGRSNDPPPWNFSSEMISVGAARPLLRSVQTTLTAPQQLIEDDRPREQADERFEPNDAAALPASAIPGLSLADTLPNERTAGDAWHDATLASSETQISTSQPGAGELPVLLVAEGSSTPNATDLVEAREAESGTGIEDAPTDIAGPADVAEPEPLMESAAAADMRPVPAEPRSSGRSCADADGAADESTAVSVLEERPETAALDCAGENSGTNSEPALAEPASCIEGNRPNKPQRQRPIQPAAYRDRRGQQRAVTASNEPSVGPLPVPSARPPAEVKLRLSLHPIQRTARLSAVLTRPEGFPERVTLRVDGEASIGAYDLQRYDDLDLPWTEDLLDGELRLASAEGWQWLRSARQVHIFTDDPSGPGLISAGVARAGAMHTVICRSHDIAAVCNVTASAGSPELTAHENWKGIPEGWAVLSNYRPTHPAVLPLAAGLRPLDPGTGAEIEFEGGLPVRPKVFAEGHPPKIVIRPVPDGAAITIGGQPASLASEEGWEAPGWDTPGRHMVDVVPGPSAVYEIAADPWGRAGWGFWNAHEGRFGEGTAEPWARAEICGANIKGPAGQVVLAVDILSTLIALGARSGAVPLLRRPDVPVSVGLVPDPPTFLLSTTGLRRRQGRVIWLGLAPSMQNPRRSDPSWTAAVRTAATRRLPLEGADSLGEIAWRKAKERARRLWRSRR